MRTSHAVGIALASLLLAACSGEENAQTGTADSSSETPADRIQNAIASVTKAVEVTEDNDPNNDIGRPGMYQAATVFYDSRAKCAPGETVHVSCGAKIEVFETANDAQARMEYIQGITDSLGGLVTEYNYVDGATLLRVSGELKPSAAEEYEAAFAD